MNRNSKQGWCLNVTREKKCFMSSFAGFWIEIIQDWIWEWEPDGDFFTLPLFFVFIMDVCHKSESSSSSEEISLKLQEGESVLKYTKKGGGGCRMMYTGRGRRIRRKRWINKLCFNVLCFVIFYVFFCRLVCSPREIAIFIGSNECNGRRKVT